MSSSPVWFVNRDVKLYHSLIHKLEKIWNETPIGQSIKAGQNVAIKTHFGAPGNTNYLRPAYVRKVVDLVRERGANPVVFETCGLGYGTKGPYAGRSTAPTYVEDMDKPKEENKEKKEEENMDKYVCDVCGYVYDPDKGDPDNGVEPGTAFEDLPDDWVCPLCGAEKSDFSKQE